MPEPSQGEISAVAWSIRALTVKPSQKRGPRLDADPSDDRLAQEWPQLAAPATALIARVLAMRANAGQRPMRLFGVASACALSIARRSRQRTGISAARPIVVVTVWAASSTAGAFRCRV